MSKNNTNLILIENFNVEEKKYYEKANEFFCSLDKSEMEYIYSVITKKNKKKKTISLRFLEWFVTKYCKLYNTMICVNNKYNNIERYYVNNYYKSYLSAFHKNFMDPFKRTKTSLKFMYKCNGFEFITSLCQLNFIKWSIEYDILKYVMNNQDTLTLKIDYVNNFYKKSKVKSITKIDNDINNSYVVIDLDLKKFSELTKSDKKKLFSIEL
jgi:hypothetical protein